MRAGIAINEANRSISGHVVELSLLRVGEIRIHRITAAIDCGVAVDPVSVEGQMISGTIVGLSAALAGEITLKGGAVEQRNFDSYPLVTIEQMPPLDVHVVPGPSGVIGVVGEEGVPTIAPAIANAIRALTGRPVRRLPLTRAGYTLVGA